MKMSIFSVRDTKAGQFMTPWFSKSLAQAQRSFIQMSNNSESIIHQFPADFAMFYLGEFDDESGEIHSIKNGEHVMSAQSAIAVEKESQ